MTGPAGGPISLIMEATRKVPVVRYALAIAAIGAAIAVTRGFMPDVGIVGMFPVLVGFILVMVVLILVAAAASARPKISVPALFLVWGVCLFVASFMLFTVTAIAFGWPSAWARLILPPPAAEAPIVGTRTTTVDSGREPQRSPQAPPLKTNNAEQPPTTPPAASPTPQSPGTSARRDPLAGISVYYYTKSSDGDGVRAALRRKGITFQERPTHKSGQVPINAIACSPDISGEALQKVINALQSAGVSIRLIHQFESSDKRRRIEILTYSYHYTDGREEGLGTPPLTAAQLAALEACPVQLANGPIAE